MELNHLRHLWAVARAGGFTSAARQIHVQQPGLSRAVKQLESSLGVVLFERVTNALKLVGDMFLSRMYRTISLRFHLQEWDTGISRKLQTIEGIYQKLTDRAAARRLEALEWIVIVLIAVEILLTLMH